MKKKIVALMLTAVMGMSLAACGSSNAGSSSGTATGDSAGTTEGGLTKVTFVSTTPVDSFDYEIIYVGQTMGYFADEGIEVEVQQAQAGNDVKMLASGEADFGIPGPTLLMQSIDSGMDLVSVFNQDPYNIFGVAYSSGSFSSLEDVKGATIAVPAETLIPYATPSLAQVGIDTDTDVNWVSLGDTRYTAVQSGEAQGVLTWTAEWGQMKGQGIDLDYLSFDDINPIVSNSIVTSRDFLEQNPDTVKGFLKAVAKSIYFMYCNSDAAADIIMNTCPTIEVDWAGATSASTAAVYQLMGTTDETAQEVLSNGIGTFDTTRWQLTLDQCIEYGSVTNNTDMTLEDVYDDYCLDDSWDKAAVEEDAANYEFSSSVYKAAN